MSSQNSQTNLSLSQSTETNSSLSQSTETNSSFSQSTETNSSFSETEVSSLSSDYDTQDENLSQELDSDWSQSDDEIGDPTWTPSLES